ncbi:hypothetical protein KHP57_04945 [Algiphilus sp. NNCM1]|uniref:capsular biosynthesis protein n=1 Tax=Algiphilus sp. TaxID=1872431 RepID=UPI001CA680F9|nr:capsular biosynthesis protein [Algiphilus sp.]MBY8965044.1 hypothetical protein [Algiphilus acroporae]MCI5104198.1 capsular biosynthesis protein [Algiphilus sp.]
MILIISSHRLAVDALVSAGAQESNLLLCLPRRFESDVGRCTFYSIEDAEAGKCPPWVSGEADPRLLYRLLPQLRKAFHPTLCLERRNWNNASITDIWTLLYIYAESWLKIVQAKGVTSVFFHDSPHRGFDSVVLELAHLLDLKVVSATSTLLDERLVLRRHPNTPIISGLQGRREIPCNHKDFSEVESQRARRLQSREAVPRPGITGASGAVSLRGQIGKLHLARRIRKFIQPAPDRFPDLVPARPVSLFQQRKFDYHVLSAIRRNVKRVNDKSVPLEALSRPYFFFALHLQPESTTIPQAGDFWHLGIITKQVRAWLPSRYTLVIKDHPRMLEFGRHWTRARSDAYYESMLTLPGVSFVDWRVPSGSILAGSSGLVAVTGSVGWEGIRAGVPTIVFGDAWYADAPGTQRWEAVLQQGMAPDQLVEPTPFKVARWVEEFTRERAVLGFFTDKQALDASQPHRDEVLAAYGSAVLEHIL